LRRYLPHTFWTFAVGTAAIAGAPFLSGFFSKDEILHAAASGGHWVLWGVALATAGLTAFYMCRAVWLTFGGEFRGSEEQRHHLHESPPVMTLPLAVLAVGAVAAGWVGIPAVMSFGTDINLFHRFLAPVVAPIGEAAHGEPGLSAGLEWLLIGVAVAMALAGYLVARRAYGRGRGLAGDEAFAARLPAARRLLADKYRVDELYDRAIVRPLAWLARMLWKVVDTLLIEGTIHVGAFMTELTGDLVRFSTTGNVRNYALYFFLGLVALFWWLLL
jgi:NADH-quinone oxidoreductase subunit L